MARGVLVLFAHGSRDPRWRIPFERLLVTLQDGPGDFPFRLAFMEFCGPTLLDVAAEEASRGAARMRVLPLFLAGGAHVASDIPRIVDEVRAIHPDLEIEVLPPVGEDPRFIALLERMARELASDLTGSCPTSTPLPT